MSSDPEFDPPGSWSEWLNFSRAVSYIHWCLHTYIVTVYIYLHTMELDLTRTVAALCSTNFF